MANKYGQTYASIMADFPKRTNGVQAPIVNSAQAPVVGTGMNTVRNNYGETRNSIMSDFPPITYTGGTPVLDPVQVPVRQTQVQVPTTQTAVQIPVSYAGNPAAVYNLNHLVGYPSNVPHVVHGTPVNVENYRFLGGRGMTADLYNQVATDTMNALRLLGGGVSATAPRRGGTSKTTTAPTPKTVPSAEIKPTPRNFTSPVYDTIPTFDPNQILNNVSQPTFSPNSTLASVINKANTQPIITPMPAHDVVVQPKEPTTSENKMLAPAQITPNLLRELVKLLTVGRFLPSF